MVALVSDKLRHTLAMAKHQRDLAREQTERAHAEMNARMRVEVELRHAQRLESVGRLAAGVAHEINTPVQFVSDSLQFMRAGLTELFALVAHGIDAADRQSRAWSGPHSAGRITTCVRL